MCRILMVQSAEPFAVSRYIHDFAALCRDSREYQGHGWGLAMLEQGRWKVHRSLTPIWEDRLDGFGTCELLAVHARSAFRNEGIALENNMPFHDDTHYFIFNGELQGVRIREEGRIGAEKIFNYIKRFNKGDMDTAFRKAVTLIPKLTRYVRAMNILMTDGQRVYANCHYGEDPDYFTLWQYEDRQTRIFCSQPLGPGWSPLANQSVVIAESPQLSRCLS